MAYPRNTMNFDINSLINNKLSNTADRKTMNHNHKINVPAAVAPGIRADTGGPRSKPLIRLLFGQKN